MLNVLYQRFPVMVLSNRRVRRWNRQLGEPFVQKIQLNPGRRKQISMLDVSGHVQRQMAQHSEHLVRKYNVIICKIFPSQRQPEEPAEEGKFVLEQKAQMCPQS